MPEEAVCGLADSTPEQQLHIFPPAPELSFNLQTSPDAGLEEAQAGIKIAGRNINNLRYADDTALMAESEEELKSLLMKVKVESEKVGLKRLKGVQPPLPFGERTRDCSPGHAGKEGRESLRRERSGILKEKERTNFFCLHSLVSVSYTAQFKLCTRDYRTMYPA